MKKLLKILIIFIIVILILYYFVRTIDLKTFISIMINFFNFKIKIKNLENLKYINERVIIMSNHYAPCDVGLIMYIFNKNTNKKFYSVSKHNIFGDKNDTSPLSNFLSLFKGLYSFFNLIPYEKGNKVSGEEVKKKMLQTVNENNTVIIFPEGTTSRKGIPSEFKPGSFKMCAENSIKIIPITLEYDKRIGMNQNDQFSINLWFNSGVTLTVHEPIYNEDPLILQKQVHSIIVDNLKQKYVDKNIINK